MKRKKVKYEKLTVINHVKNATIKNPSNIPLKNCGKARNGKIRYM